MKITTHRPFAYITGFFCLGITLDHFVQVPFGVTCLFVFVFLALSWGINRNAATHCRDAPHLILMIFLFFAITGIGAAYSQSRRCVKKNHIMHVAKYYRRKPVEVRGMIISDVEEREAFNGIKTTFTLNIHEVRAKWGWQKQTGTILVNVFRHLDVHYGDDVMLEGKLHRPYNFSEGKNFSYRDYLYRRDIHFILSVKKSADVQVINQNRGRAFRAVSLRLRKGFKNILSEHLSKNESGIMRAVLLGDRSGIPKSVRTLFVQTGTAHILAISGLHIGIVAALFLVFMKLMPVGRKGQFGGVIILLLSYAFLTGGRPSVIRATIMMAVFLTSFIIEKEPDILNTLGLAALIILLMNPLNLFDVGFQLSFVCVFSIITLNLKRKKKKSLRLFDKRIQHRAGMVNPVYYYILQSLRISLAIWIGVAGLVVYYFGIITPITILANLLVVPLISVIVTLGFSLLLVAAFLPSWAFMFSVCLKVVLNVMVGFIYLFTKIPFAYIYIRDVSIWHIVVYYTILFLAIFGPWGWIRKNDKFQMTPAGR